MVKMSFLKTHLFTNIPVGVGNFHLLNTRSFTMQRAIIPPARPLLYVLLAACGGGTIDTTAITNSTTTAATTTSSDNYCHSGGNLALSSLGLRFSTRPKGKRTAPLH